MKIILFSALLVFMGSTAHSQNQCVDIFLDVAKMREADIIAELKEVEEIPTNSPRYEDISALGGRNLVEKIELENIAAVVKWSKLASVFEPLGYKILKLLNIDSPVTIKVKNGAQVGSAQIFIRESKTLFDLENGFWFDYNPVIRLFDRLTLNSDRRPQNILVPASGPYKQAQQKPIDHELIFDLGPHSEAVRYLKEDPKKFLMDVIPKIQKDHPEVHMAMLSPSVRRQILAHMRNVREIGELEHQHVNNYFRAYKEVTDSLAKTKSTPPAAESTPKKPGLFDRFFNKMFNQN